MERTEYINRNKLNDKLEMKSEEGMIRAGFILADIESRYLPSFEFKIEIFNRETKIYENKVWFGKHDMKGFIEESDDKIGSQLNASLVSMSPNEFILVVSKHDNDIEISIKFKSINSECFNDESIANGYTDIKFKTSINEFRKYVNGIKFFVENDV